MLESLVALPLCAGLEILLFLGLYRLLRFSGKQTALLALVVVVAALLLYSLLDWPGADVLSMYIAVVAVTAYLLGIVSGAHEQSSDTDRKQPWFHWGPATIVIFFVLLFALDGVLVMVARQGLPQGIADRLLPRSDENEHVRSLFPGVVANNYQKKEGEYNRYLDKVKRQQRLGWQVHKGWLQPPVAGRAAAFQVRVLAADDTPITFAAVHGVFQRLSDSREDRAFAMQEVEPGLYRAAVALPDPGMWHLVLTVERGDQLHELHADTTVAARAAPPRAAAAAR